MSAPLPDALRGLAADLGALREQNRALFERMAESERRFARISRGVLRAEEEERARLSRELHDGLGQELTAVKIQLELLEREAPPELGARLAACREMVGGALEEVRQLARLLRPRMLDELGLAETLRWLARSVQQRTGLAVRVENELGDAPLPPEIETLAFRAAQEALTNVVRHANARHAALRLARRAGGRLVVRVEDDGRGFPAERARAPGAFGLPGLRDRARVFGGELRVDSRPGEGTVVEIEVPVDGEAT